MFISGQAAEVIAKGNRIGILGNLHPAVITNFELNLPCSAFEINIEPFLSKEGRDLISPEEDFD